MPEGSKTPTFCSAVLRICNRRWDGVPFILKVIGGKNSIEGILHTIPLSVFAHGIYTYLRSTVALSSFQITHTKHTQAGKALDDRKAEIRIQFKRPPAGSYMFDGQPTPPNELVIRLQPKEAIYLKTNVKAPGLRSAPIQSELDLSYHSRYPDVSLSTKKRKREESLLYLMFL